MEGEGGHVVENGSGDPRNLGKVLYGSLRAGTRTLAEDDAKVKREYTRGRIRLMIGTP